MQAISIAFKESIPTIIQTVTQKVKAISAAWREELISNHQIKQGNTNWIIRAII